MASSAGYADRSRWIGAGLIPARDFGYLSATWPLVVVEMDGNAITVRLRPALLGRFVGAEVLTANPAEVEAYPVRDDASWQGVEFRPVKRSSFYFFTSSRYSLLRALTKAGFTVSAGPGRERPTW